MRVGRHCLCDMSGQAGGCANQRWIWWDRLWWANLAQKAAPRRYAALIAQPAVAYQGMDMRVQIQCPRPACSASCMPGCALQALGTPKCQRFHNAGGDIR